MGPGNIRLIVVREPLLALLVLALAFLNFGHGNLAFAAGGHVVSVSSSFCGDPLAPAGSGHPPCHACRIGNGADLPPPAANPEPVVFAVLPLACLGLTGPAHATGFVAAASPRGPPAA